MTEEVKSGRRWVMRLQLTLLLLLLASSVPALAAHPPRKPLSKEEVLELVRNYVPSERLADLVQQYGIDFEPTEDVLRAFREAGAEEVVIKALRAAKQTHPAELDPAAKAKADLLRQHLARGAELRDQKLYAQAEQEYSAAAQLDPERSDIHLSLGYVLGEQQKWDASIAETREALRLRPDLAAAHNNLGWALSNQHDLNGAIAEYREALRLKPSYVKAHLNLANALGKAGDLEAAIAEYREASRLEPNSVPAHYGLGLMLEKKGDRQAAGEEYRAAYKLAPDNPSIRAAYEKLATPSPAPPPAPAERSAFSFAQMKVDSVKFFESGLPLAPLDQRKYEVRFRKASARYIAWELHLVYPQPSQRAEFDIEAVWYGRGGNLIHRQTLHTFVDPGWKGSTHVMGWGCSSHPCQTWERGSYRVDFNMRGSSIATGSFEVH